MIINDKNGLLKVNSMMDELLEELDQNAAGPELDKAAEPDNEATLEKEPSELTSDIDSEDVYGDDEEFAEDVGEVVITERSLKSANNALVKHDYNMAVNTANAMPTKRVKGDTRTTAQVIAAKQNALEKAERDKTANSIHRYGPRNGIMTGQGAADEAQAQAKENAAAVRARKDEKAKRRALRQTARANSREELTKKINDGTATKLDKVRARLHLYEELSDIELLEILQESGFEANLENLLILKEGLADGTYFLEEEELETEVMPAEAEDSGVADDEPAERGEEKEADEEKEDSEEEKDKSEEDEESDEKEDDEKKDEEKEETVNEGLDGIFALINQINESLSQEAAGPELEGAKELENEATVESDGKELTSAVDNKDVYDAEDHEQKEDVGEVVVKESEQLAAGPELEAGKELKNEATKEEAEKELTSDKDNKDLFPAEDHEQKEDVGEVVVKESEQLAAGPELDSAKELDNEATEEKDPKTEPASTDNKDVYCDCSHKQVEDVVEVVIEAVSVCKAQGVPATLENITEAARPLFETKNFDIDAFIMSKEMNGSKKFDEYEKLEGKGAECALTGLRESVKYNSLKEACMMDEGYFAEDSYVKETASEKVQKLTEQVSLLMAREANDPLYDELLKESAYCMRLREQLQNKYKKVASAKVNVITESK